MVTSNCMNQSTNSSELTDAFHRFQAAWEGDNEKIKELTLAKWGPESDRKPLHVATQDGRGFTPFAIATVRRHLETAKMLLGIANAQFKDPDSSKNKRRYEISGANDYDDDDSDGDSSEDDSSDGLDISSNVVDDTYTYDNVAELQESVGSKVSGESIGTDKQHQKVFRNFF